MTLLKRDIRSLEETAALAAEVSVLLTPGSVLLLTGDLGAGKTTFVQALARTYGITRTVTSPTFTLANEYPIPAGGKLVHYDLYRLAEPSGLYDLGLEDALEYGARLAIEWPEKAQSVLDLEVPCRLRLNLTTDENGIRQATLLKENVS
jgi:tRNA threonylcarbamoyladenosine biosynthesis protein TsaE